MSAAKKNVEKKIAEGVYQFESVPCGLCGGDDFDIIATKDRYGLDNRVVICEHCGLIQTMPRMTAESYRDFYRDDYRALYSWRQSIDDHFAQMARRAKLVLQFIGHHTKLKSGKVLDVGCSSGGMLQIFKQAGYDVTGVDYDKDRLAYGVKKGIDLFEGDAFDVEGKFDLIIYSHVLEHILDLKGELNRIAQLLNRGGYLFVELPNMDYWLAHETEKCLQNAHTYYFTPKTLNDLMSMCGFVQCAAENCDAPNFATLWQFIGG